jgi:hypothetical protein
MSGGRVCRDCSVELSPNDAAWRNRAGEYLCDDCYGADVIARLEKEIDELRRANTVLVAAVTRFTEAQHLALDELEEATPLERAA